MNKLQTMLELRSWIGKKLPNSKLVIINVLPCTSSTVPCCKSCSSYGLIVQVRRKGLSDDNYLCGRYVLEGSSEERKKSE